MAKGGSRRQHDFDKVNEYKERFRRESSDHLRQRLTTGSLLKEAAVAMREILEERAKTEPDSN